MPAEGASPRAGSLYPIWKHCFWVPDISLTRNSGMTVNSYDRKPRQRSFSVARPTRASTTEMIQKRTTTVDSFQPFCS